MVAWYWPLPAGPSQFAAAKKVTRAIARESTRATSSMAAFPTAREPIDCRGLRGTPVASSATSRPGEDFLRRHQPLRPGAGEVDPDPWLARRSQLPAGAEEARRFGQVFGLRHLAAVGEGDRLRASPGEAQADFAAGLEVEHVVIERAGVSSGYEVGDGPEVARPHRRLQVPAAVHRRQALPAAKLGQEHVALRPEPVEVQLDRPHPFLQRLDPAFDLLGRERGEIFRHRRLLSFSCHTATAGKRRYPAIGKGVSAGKGRYPYACAARQTCAGPCRQSWCAAYARSRAPTARRGARAAVPRPRPNRTLRRSPRSSPSAPGRTPPGSRPAAPPGGRSRRSTP